MQAAALLHASFASLQYEPDCPGYPTERYTVDKGVQVADMTADKFQSRIIDLSNGFATLSLPLSQRLPEKAMTVNMTKFNTVPTNMSDDMGNIVTEMVTWRTSAVYGKLELSSRAYSMCVCVCVCVCLCMETAACESAHCMVYVLKFVTYYSSHVS